MRFRKIKSLFKKEGIEIANKLGACGFYEVSAKTGEGIEEALKAIGLDAYKLHGQKLVHISKEQN